MRTHRLSLSDVALARPARRHIAGDRPSLPHREHTLTPRGETALGNALGNASRPAANGGAAAPGHGYRAKVGHLHSWPPTPVTRRPGPPLAPSLASAPRLTSSHGGPV